MQYARFAAPPVVLLDCDAPVLPAWAVVPWPSPAADRQPPLSKAEEFQRYAAEHHAGVVESMEEATEKWQLRAVAEMQRERRIFGAMSRYYRAVETGAAEPTDDFAKMMEIAG